MLKEEVYLNLQVVKSMILFTLIESKYRDLGLEGVLAYGAERSRSPVRVVVSHPLVTLRQCWPCYHPPVSVSSHFLTLNTPAQAETLSSLSSANELNTVK